MVKVGTEVEDEFVLDEDDEDDEDEVKVVFPVVVDSEEDEVVL